MSSLCSLRVDSENRRLVFFLFLIQACLSLPTMLYPQNFLPLVKKRTPTANNLKGLKTLYLLEQQGGKPFPIEVATVYPEHKMLKAHGGENAPCQGLCWELLFIISAGLLLLFLLVVLSTRLDWMMFYCVSTPCCLFF